jgi:hypothetical protein
MRIHASFHLFIGQAGVGSNIELLQESIDRLIVNLIHKYLCVIEVICATYTVFSTRDCRQVDTGQDAPPARNNLTASSFNCPRSF